MKSNKSILLGAAVAGILMGASVGQAHEDKAKAKADAKGAVAATGECSGVNACKGQGECGGAGHECAGKNECKGKGWKKMSAADCKKAKGTFKASNG